MTTFRETTAVAPPAPGPISEADNLILSWQVPAGAKGVIVTVDGTEHALGSSSHVPTSYTISGLRPNILHKAFITFTNAAGRGPAGAPILFTLTESASTPPPPPPPAGPAISAILPTNGPAAGGTPVTLTGTNLTGATEVKVGNSVITVLKVAATSITFTTPAGSGSENVSVVTPAGTSNVLPFVFVAAPPPATFTVKATGPNEATVAWAGIVPVKLGRNGTDTGGTGPWDTTNGGPSAAQLATMASFSFEALVQGFNYTYTATMADGSTMTVSLVQPITTVTPPPPPPSGLLQGVYTTNAAAGGPAQTAAWPGQTKTRLDLGSEYCPSNGGWPGIDGSNGGIGWILDGWGNSSVKRMQLGLPMYPNDSSGKALGTLAQGAAGAYNSFWTTLGQTLIAAAKSYPAWVNPFLRFGWEFDGNWYIWQALTPADEANYKAYFRNIVEALRATGLEFVSVWNPDAGAFDASGYNVGLAYPGDDVVDLIAIDAYDRSWNNPFTAANAWSSVTLPSLSATLAFAEAQGKPLAVTEWGIWQSDGSGSGGLGDDPLYVTNFLAWMHANCVMENYFDFGTSQITDGSYPKSLAALTAGLSAA